MPMQENRCLKLPHIYVVNESEVTRDVGRHVVNEPKVRCRVVGDLKYLKSDFRWIIHLRLYSGPLGL